MKLLIISHTPHYRKDGQIVGWGSTLREIDHLARLFDEVVHIAPLHPEPDPGSSLPYQADNVRLHAVPPAGGDTLAEKVSVLKRLPEYIRTIRQELINTDVVHVRCPAAISLVTLVILAFRKYPQHRWVKYAGNWKPDTKTPLSFRLQRWMINRNLFRGVATINGKWENQPGHVKSFYNPCLTDAERTTASEITEQKTLKPPYHFLFVGRLETAKGIKNILEILRDLVSSGVNCDLDLIGSGPEYDSFVHDAAKMGIMEIVHFVGFIPRDQLDAYYRKAHFFLLPSQTEGWPKVLSEAMAYGVVPLASNISSIPQILQETQAGLSLDPSDIQSYVNAIKEMVNNPEKWYAYSRNAAKASTLFTYTHYLHQVQALFLEEWDLALKHE